MAVVPVSVNGRVYDVACDESQVARVAEMGREVDSRAQALLRSVGAVSDARLLVMVALLLADELTDTRDELRRAHAQVAAAMDGEAALAESVEALARRIEGIAERLERA